MLHSEGCTQAAEKCLRCKKEGAECGEPGGTVGFVMEWWGSEGNSPLSYLLQVTESLEPQLLSLEWRM